MINDNDIAVVGMSCVFPGAPDLEHYWNNIKNKVNAIQEAPPNRIDKVFFDANSKEIDRLYTTRGGFIDEYVNFDPIEFGIVPKTVEGTEPDQLMSLKLTHRALKDAGVFEKNIPLKKAGIIIGRGNYGGIEMAKLAELIIGGDAVVETLKYIMPHLSDAELFKAKKAYHKLRGNFSADNVMGTVPNLVAALVANRFDFGGPAYTVDAACASSLIAIDNGVRELQSGRCDLVVAGAIHLSQNPVLWSVFSMMGALSRKQVVSPFDKSADGVLTGEGCGFVVLRKLKDAIKDDQRIYSVIKGVGLSSDGANASLMSPSSVGQIKAIKYAWEQTDLNINDIGYIEAHGTATPLGDKTELETLRLAFGKNDSLPRAGLGSVKSMIGHAMPAAGMAGFIKTALALHHNTLPPTLNCENPVEAMKQTRFKPTNEAIDWDSTDLPKLAGVNAFGFGGANAHAILQGFNSFKKAPPKRAKSKEYLIEDEVILMARNTHVDLIKSLNIGDYSMGTGVHRLAVFNPTDERIQSAIKIINKGKNWHKRLDIWYTKEPLLLNDSKIALIFPGLDGPGLQSLKVANIEQVTESFNIPKPKYANYEEGVEVFLGLDEASRILYKALRSLKIVPDVIAGHSLGEWGACHAAGMTQDKTVEQLEKQAIETTHEKNKAVFLSVGCGIKEIMPIIKNEEDIYIANDNCPHQIVLCGTPSKIQKIRQVINEKKYVNYKLPFQTGYHTPFAEQYLDDVKNNLEKVITFKKPRTPIWSGITAAPYPDKISEIKQLHIDFITQPVQFRTLTENLYNHGVRFFLQVGAGATLGFIQDTLKGKTFASIASADTKKTAMKQLQRVVASLFVEGRDSDFSILKFKNSLPKKENKISLSKKLDLGLSPILLKDIIEAANLKKPSLISDFKENGKENILKAFNENLININETQKDLLKILGKKKNEINKYDEIVEVKKEEEESSFNYSPNKIFKKEIEFSIEKFPELLDHCPFKKRSKINLFNDDKDPIVPLTMLIQVVCELAKEASPKQNIIEIKNINVYQFFWVKKPVHTEIIGAWKNAKEIAFKIDKYFSVDIVLSNEYNVASNPLELQIGEPVAFPIQTEDVYQKSLMFHDASYQGINNLTKMGSNGIEAIIRGVENKGKGSLMDNMGQLVALWYQLRNINYISFPVKIEKIELYDDFFNQIGDFKCTCILKETNDDFLISDIYMTRNNKLWAKAIGWHNRKSEVDEQLYKSVVNTEYNSLSEEIYPGIFFFEKKYKRVNSWFLAQSFCLNKLEQDYRNSLPLSRQTSWLMGRIVAKDALKTILTPYHDEKVHVASITVMPDKIGKPIAKFKEMNLNVSIAHKDNYAVAIANKDENIGIDIEVIKDRDPSFINMVLNNKEIELLPSLDKISEWITRCWVAKEAYGKYTGFGLKGNPKNYQIEKIEDSCIWINQVKIKTVKHNNYIIGWTIVQ